MHSLIKFKIFFAWEWDKLIGTPALQTLCERLPTLLTPNFYHLP